MTLDGAGRPAAHAPRRAGDVREGGDYEFGIFRITPKPRTESNVAEENGRGAVLFTSGNLAGFHGGPTLSSKRSP